MNDDLDPRLRAAFRAARVPGASPALRDAVRRIPLEEGAAGPARPHRRMAIRLAGALVAVAAVVGLVVVPMLSGDGLGIGPAASSPPSSGPSAVGPTSPSPAPAATPSASAPGSSSAVPTSSPAGSPAPADFAVSSVSFATPLLGWAAGTGTCATGSCLWILHTADGGGTWSTATSPMPDPGASTGRPTSILFASERDGWLFGPGLWSTHDGGASWTRIALPDVPPTASVPSVAAAGGLVSAAVLADGPVRVATSGTTADSWTVASATVQPGAGPVPSPQLVRAAASGAGGTGGPPAGWLVEVDRTVVGGLREVSGEWRTWTPPCLDAAGPALLVAADTQHVAALCDVGLWSTPQGVRLIVSTDAGATFTSIPGKVPLGSVTSAAAAGTAILAGGGASGGAGGSAIVATFDGGQTWSAVHGSSATGAILDLAFVDPEHAFAVAATGAPDGSLLRSDDGGRTWISVGFVATGG